MGPYLSLLLFQLLTLNLVQFEFGSVKTLKNERERPASARTAQYTARIISRHKSSILLQIYANFDSSNCHTVETAQDRVTIRLGLDTLIASILV